MYQNIYYDYKRSIIHLWDDELGYKRYNYRHYAYMSDPEGEYECMNGEKLRKVYKWSEAAEKSGRVFEHNLRPEVKFLINKYGSSDDVSTNHTIAFIDIEVAKLKKHSTVKEAKNPITAITIYNSNTKSSVCFLLDKEKQIKSDIYNNTEIRTYKQERQLLIEFLYYWDEELKPTIVTGWNVLGYDLPYIFNRLENVLGQYSGNILSPIKVVKSYVNRREEDVFIIGGISIMDYIELYKKFVPKERPMYTLEYIATLELGRGKIKFEGDIDSLYKTDIHKFIEYNVEDVQLVVDLDAKLDFIAIAMGVCHSGHVPYEDFKHSSKFIEGAIYTALNRDGKIALNSQYDGNREKAKGAYVKIPKSGIYKWVYDLDLRGLYPSNIISLNISPETKYAYITGWDETDYQNKIHNTYEINLYNPNIYQDDVIVVERDNLMEYLTTNALCIASNGVIFRTDEIGIIPKLLIEWTDKRAEYRKIANDAHDKGDEVRAMEYDRKQQIQKIFSNSIYGVTLLPSFKFYDKDNGEAVTLTGQSVIQHTFKIANQVYNQLVGTEGIDYVIYGDTDSAYFPAETLVKVFYPDITDDEIADKTIEVATSMQNLINDSYDTYAEEFHALYTHKWLIKQELVASRVFWGSAKKRYAMHKIRDGHRVVDEFEIKGFEAIKSDFPKLFRDFLKHIIESILKDTPNIDINAEIIDFKTNLANISIDQIMKPTSVKVLEKFITDPIEFTHAKGTPIHVKSAINYNKFLSVNRITKYSPIYGNEKIRYTYLTENSYNFETMALKGYDDPPEIVEFVTKYMDREKMFESIMKTKLNTIWEDLGWGKIVFNKNVIKAFDFN